MRDISLRLVSWSVSAVVLAGLAACAQPYQQQPYYGQTQGYPQPANQAQSTYAEFGTVANIEAMQSTASAPPSGAGAVIGGVVGGIVGNQVGGGMGRALSTAAGVVGGAVVGNNIEGRRTEVQQTWRLSIKTDNGAYRAFDVGSPGDLRVGDRVRIEGGQISRI